MISVAQIGIDSLKCLSATAIDFEKPNKSNYFSEIKNLVSFKRIKWKANLVYYLSYRKLFSIFQRFP